MTSHNHQGVSATDPTDASGKKTPLIPRSYQVEMFERALGENTIAVMDTGTGKTLVAAMLVKEMMQRELQETRTMGQRKLNFFIVNNVPLVRQQASVIRDFCDAEVVELCGASNTKKLEMTLWTEIAKYAHVVVLTAQILLDVLHQGFWHMHQINLLIFDEAHHARKSHPYNYIMTEFYHNKTIAKPVRPRVFGMTASPVTNTGPKHQYSASDLEHVLDSKVFSIDVNELQNYVERPTESVVVYDNSAHSSLRPSDLTRMMAPACRHDSILEHTLNNIYAVQLQLGPWCTEQIWIHTVENLQIASRTNSAIGDLRDAKAIIDRWTSPPLACSVKDDAPSNDITPKVQALLRILREAHSDLKDEFCGIIFVERRDVVAGLTILLREMEEFREVFRVQELVGHNKRDVLLRTTLKRQNDVITLFRDKVFNLLIATSVAEEGLDIQACNVVIRFDPITTTTSYMQSRGRARKKDSRYVIMRDKYSRSQLDTLDKIHASEQKMREWCQISDSVRHKRDLADAKDLSIQAQQYLIPSTEALLTPSSAIPLLHRYCASLARDEYCESKPVFQVDQDGMAYYVCSLKLPALAPIKEVLSDGATSKDTARRSAAFKACKQLHELGALDDHFEPFVEKADLEEQVEELDLPKADQNNSYPRNTPQLWRKRRTEQTSPTTFFGCTVTFVNDGYRRRHQYGEISIITRGQLPFASHTFNVYINGEIRKLTMSATPAPLQLNADQVSRLQQFTLVLFTRIARKKFECPDDMPFFVAPISGLYPLERIISWDEVELGQSLEILPITRESLLSLNIKELVVTLIEDHTLSFFVQEAIQGCGIDDQMPESLCSAEIATWRAARGGDEEASNPTFKQYFRWKYEVECPDNETMLLARKVKRIRNHLQPAVLDESEQDSALLTLLPLSVCAKSTVSASVLRMAQLIPSTLFHLDSMLLTHEAQISLGLQDLVQLELLQVALTTPSTNRDHNYERLEILGDSFLKFSSALRMFILNPAKNEGQLSLTQVGMISNTALLRHTLRCELYRYVTSVPFHRKGWRPVRFVVDGKVCEDRQEHMLSNKTLADFVEATLGAAFLSGGVATALGAAKVLGVPFHEFGSWSDFCRVYSDQKAGVTTHGDHVRDKFEGRILKLEETLGYKFRRPELVQEAMTHASAIQQIGQDRTYERLEYLGDAVHDFLVTKHYFEQYLDAPPGVISHIKITAVNNGILGALAIMWGLDELLIHGSEALAADITEAIAAVKASTGTGEYWVNVKMPKVLGDLVESTLGAVFVDSGFQFEAVLDLFVRKVQPFLERHLNLESIIIHPTKAVLEYLQARGCSKFSFERRESEETARKPSILGRSSLGIGIKVDPVFECDFRIHGTTVATATGYRMTELKKQVATEALRRVKTEEGLLEELCSCPRSKKRRGATLLDKYQDAKR
ncbi:Dicer-like protein 1 [Podila clonocystis]|nr:Dicer-like protein 1 [Podila clonocystis]